MRRSSDSPGLRRLDACLAADEPFRLGQVGLKDDARDLIVRTHTLSRRSMRAFMGALPWGRCVEGLG